MRETSNKGKKRARSEYEAASAVLSTGTHTASTPEQQAKVSSARTRGVLLAFVDKALANARLVSF